MLSNALDWDWDWDFAGKVMSKTTSSSNANMRLSLYIVGGCRLAQPAPRILQASGLPVKYYFVGGYYLLRGAA